MPQNQPPPGHLEHLTSVLRIGGAYGHTIRWLGPDKVEVLAFLRVFTPTERRDAAEVLQAAGVTEVDLVLSDSRQSIALATPRSRRSPPGYLEHLSSVLRIGGAYGDAYTWCGAIRWLSSKKVEVLAVLRAPTRSEWRAAAEVLQAAGITEVVFARQDGRQRIVLVQPSTKGSTDGH